MSTEYDIKVELKDPTKTSIKIGDKTVDAIEYTIDKGTYKESLKENGFNITDVEKIEKFNEQYTKTVVATVVNISKDSFKAGNDIVLTHAPLGISARNRIDVRVDKSVTIPYPGKPGETITGPSIKVQVKTTYTKLTSGYIKTLKKDLIEQMAKG